MDKLELYDIIYNITVDRLNYYDPCKWKDGRCERDRLRNDNRGCCKPGNIKVLPCPHLSETGCTIESLGCKLWLCSFAASKNPELVIVLETLKSVAFACDIDINLTKKTKEETLDKPKMSE